MINLPRINITDNKTLLLILFTSIIFYILIYLDEWYNLTPTQQSDLYLGNDVPITEQSVFTLPIHQRTDNFTLRVFSDSPFPVSLTSMMWEGNYSPRFYRRS